MPVSVVKGRASRVETSTAISGGSLSGNFFVSSAQLISLLVGQTPVQFAAESVPSVKEGDEVAAVGELKNGAMTAMALRNVTSDVIYYGRSISYPKQATWMGIALVVVGLGTLGALGIGIIPLLFSIVMFRAGKKYQQAWKMIETA